MPLEPFQYVLIALAAVAAGADGLMIEVHNDPPHALSDGPQSLTPEAFDDLAKAADLVFQAVLAGTAAMTS